MPFFNEKSSPKAYLDNSATTKPSENAIKAAEDAFAFSWGNPSSLHFMGSDASSVVEKSRASVAKILGCEEKEIYFSSGGTASNNTAIFGGAAYGRRYGKRIVTTSIEHPSVSKCIDALEKDGFEIVRLSPDESGNIPCESIYNAIDENTALVSIMAVNNETGCILPIDKVKGIIRRKRSNAVFHTDAVQAFCKIPLSASVADMISISAHKFHGIKGAGALYVSKDVKIKPYLLGGGQENNLFSGTQNVPAIAALGAAAEEAENITENLEKVGLIRDYLVSKLTALENVFVNSPEGSSAYITNISVLGVPSQVLVNGLSEMGICVSAGSACSKGHRSETLKSMNLSPDRIDSAVRISLSRYTEKSEIDLLTDGIEELIKQVR